MQDALQLLCQYRLPHLQVHLLQVEKNMAFLLRPTKVSELFGSGTGGARLGEEVPLDGISMGVTNFMFHVHLPEGMHKGHQAFLPRDGGTLSVI
jgi:hypothetical protein